MPPTGRGLIRLVSDEHTGRCPECGRAWARRADGTLIAHAGRAGDRCEGSGQAPAEDLTVASWLPILRGVTPHGLRHGLQTWMDEDGIPEVLKTERMGHEMPGMHGVYGHVSPAMRDDLKDALQERWEASLRDRARLRPRSIVPTLDALLVAYRQASVKIRYLGHA
jgi:integrase